MEQQIMEVKECLSQEKVEFQKIVMVMKIAFLKVTVEVDFYL